MELPGNTGMNEYVIKLINGKRAHYKSIYALSLVKLETWKTYIKSHLKPGFISPSKSLTGAPTLFNKKPNSSLCLYIDYQG